MLELELWFLDLHPSPPPQKNPMGIHGGECAYMHFAGRKKTHKGGHRHFTSEDDLAREQEKARKEREWRVHEHFLFSGFMPSELAFT